MLTRFKKIKNIGRFCDCNPSGKSFSSKTVVIGKNGDGKSTLTATFRSATLNEPKILKERKTFGSTAEQKVEMVLTEGGVNRDLNYEGGVWNGAVPGFVIFDSRFIAQNIFDSERLMDEHRSNLHRVVVGLGGKTLAASIEAKSKDIRTKEQDLLAKNREYAKEEFAAVLEIDAFLTLQPDLEIKKKIDDLQNQKDFILLTGKPSLPSVSTRLPDDLRENLTKDSASIHSRAKEVIEAHVKTHWLNDAHRREFLAEGIGLVKDEGCPFCGQNLEPVSALLDTYRSFFDDEYVQWEATVRRSLASFRGWNADAEIKALRLKVTEWRKYLPAECDAVSAWLDEHGEVLLAAKSIFDAECEKKSANLQYIVDFASFKEVEVLLGQLDGNIASLNVAIDAYKLKAEAGDPAELNAQLINAKAVKVRQEPRGIEFCAGYSGLKNEIEHIKTERDAEIERLRQYSAEVFASHQTKINEVLEKLDADFRVDNLTEKTDRRKVDPVYCGFDLVFFGQHRVVTEGQEEGDYTIHNTLSQGDKSLLAFAFFIATIWNDVDIGMKIVVVDDPVSSFDRERKAGTVVLLANLRNSDEVAPEQLIILTHEIGFLSEIYSNRLFIGTKYLKLVPGGITANGCKMSDIQDCDPEEDFLKDHVIKRYEKIEKMVTSHVQMTENAYNDCRLLLEALMKQKYWPLLRELVRQRRGLNDFITKLHELGIYSDARRDKFLAIIDRLNQPHHASTGAHSDTSEGDIGFVLRETMDLAKEI